MRGQNLRLVLNVMLCLTHFANMFSVALPRGPDRVDSLRHPKCALGRAQPDAIADAEREPDADHHDRFEHRRRVQRQPPAGVRGAGQRDAARAERARAEAERGAGAAGGDEREPADHGQVELCHRERDEGPDEAVRFRWRALLSSAARLFLLRHPCSSLPPSAPRLTASLPRQSRTLSTIILIPTHHLHPIPTLSLHAYITRLRPHTPLLVLGAFFIISLDVCIPYQYI